MVGKSGRTYSIDLYIPDATATALTFNAAGLAASTSPTTYRVPEDVAIVDLSIAAAPTAVGAALNVNGAVANGCALRWANQLASLSNRAKVKIAVAGGDFIGFTQF
jgi:hypothetical protein